MSYSFVFKNYLLSTILVTSFAFISCSNDNDIEASFAWSAEDLAQTIWEGQLVLGGKEEPILLSFDSNSQGYCYLNQKENASCLFEFFIEKNQIRFYNTYGDEDKLIVTGLWNFVLSKKKEIQLCQIKTKDNYDYLFLEKKIPN